MTRYCTLFQKHHRSGVTPRHNHHDRDVAKNNEEYLLESSREVGISSVATISVGLVQGDRPILTSFSSKLEEFS